MRVAYVLGGALGGPEELLEATNKRPSDGTFVINDQIVSFEGEVEGAVSFHAEKMRRWLRFRTNKRYPFPKRVIIPKSYPDWFKEIGESSITLTYSYELAEFFFPDQTDSGSSGLFAVKVALESGFDVVICCGIPMNPYTGYDNDPYRKWGGALRHRKGWEQAYPHLKNKVFSMSGWTKKLLGPPPFHIL